MHDSLHLLSNPTVQPRFSESVYQTQLKYFSTSPRHPSIISLPHTCFQPFLYPPTISIKAALLSLSRMTLDEERSAELQETVQGCYPSSVFLGKDLIGC